MFFGATSTMKIVLVSIACFFPVLLQTIYGARRLSTIEKVTLPLRGKGVSKADGQERARRWLAEVGLSGSEER